MYNDRKEASQPYLSVAIIAHPQGRETRPRRPLTLGHSDSGAGLIILVGLDRHEILGNFRNIPYRALRLPHRDTKRTKRTKRTKERA
jgi:hypothetical protein